MATDRDELVDQVTQLATDHADLLGAVRAALPGPTANFDVVDGHVVLHVPLAAYAELTRLTT